MTETQRQATVVLRRANLNRASSVRPVVRVFPFTVATGIERAMNNAMT
jgi:hypothetical protein